MKRRLIVEPEAEADVDQIYAWYENQRAGLGDDFLLCVEAAIESIAERPQSFPIISRRTRRVLIRRFPYFILFVATKEYVLVVGVFHGSRSPQSWKPRAR